MSQAKDGHTEILVKDDGPLVVTGSVSLIDAAGGQFQPEQRSIALCRCGGSHSKPFCDGTHKRIDFQSQPRADEFAGTLKVED